MTQHTIELSEETRVEVKNVAGDLILKGWNRPELQIKDFSEEINIEQEEHLIRLNCPDDCRLQLPHNARVEVGNVGGDARVHGLAGALSLEMTGGDLLLRDTGQVTAGPVGGDISAKRVRDDLEIKNVGGDGVIRDVNGQFTARSVGSDLIAKDVHGDVVVEQVGGDAVLQDLDGQCSAKAVGGDLHLSEIKGGIEAEAGGDAVIVCALVPWQAYAIKAGGDIYTEIPQETNAEFELNSAAKKIQINLAGKKQTIAEETHHLSLGEGGPAVSLTAGGEITLTDKGSKWSTGQGMDFGLLSEMGNMAEEMAQHTSEEIEKQLGKLEEHLNAHLADLSGTLELAGLSEERAKEVQERVEEARQHAAQSAQRAQSKLERKLAQAQRKAARHARRQRRKAAEFDVESIFGGESSPSKVSDEDRIMILKMLQEKKITTEQANELLAALEGKG